MKLLATITALGLFLSAAPETFGPILGRASNSEASSQRGREAFAEGNYEEAVNEFGVAAEIKPGPEASFNLGTARVAAGDVAGGLRALSQAFENETLATDVRYNGGWAALEAGDWDNAIRAYEEVLRDRPADANAKRNLEIALRKKQEQQDQQSQPDPQPQDPQSDEDDQNEGEQPQPEGDDPQQQTDPNSIDSVLRSVEQQEKEELDRMRRSRRGRKADW